MYRVVETSSICPSCDHDRLPFNSFYSKDNAKGNVVSQSYTAGCGNIDTSSLVTVTIKDLTQKPETIIMWQNQQQCPYSDFFEQYHNHCSCVQLFQSVPLHSNGTNQEKRQAHTLDNIQFSQQTGNVRHS